MNSRRFYHRRNASRSRGVGLVTAIFLLVVLSALGMAMVSLFTSQQSSAALDEQGARAYQAARAGIEWGMFQHLQAAATAGRGCDAASLDSASVTSFPMPAGTSLGDFVVTVTCTPTGPAGLTRWVIVSTACSLQPPNGACPAPVNNPDYVERRIEVEL